VSIDLNLLLSLLVGLLAGFALHWFLSRGKRIALEEQKRNFQKLEAEVEARDAQIESLKNDIQAHGIEKATLEERIRQFNQLQADLETKLVQKDATIDSLNQEVSSHQTTIAELQTAMEKDRQATEEKLALLEDAKAKLGNEFKVLANQIFEAKGKTFSERNRASLDEVLKPIREQLGDFRKRVDEVHLNDAKDRASLREHLTQLESLNRQMSEDALNLTHALKGESKAQGDWGEMILERILESSGLREGHEFLREDSTDIGGGKRHRPDVIVRMPGEKHIIIDSKVSLTDYERALSATETTDRKQAVKAHINSLKNHIRSLSDKRYDQLPGVHSPDYVLMFVPIEGAYLMAIEADQGIFEAAFDKRVAVVTPSTLYATLKLIEQLWRYEHQSENVVKLIGRASKLHDKMVDFVSAFEEIGQRLDQAQTAYDSAHNRIKSGRGNVINQIHDLGRLAGKTKKELPKHLIESAAIQDQTEETG